MTHTTWIVTIFVLDSLGGFELGRRNLDKPRARGLKADGGFERRCGMYRYASEVDAKIRLGGMPVGKVARKCPNCGGWHVVDQGTVIQSKRGARNGGRR